VKHPSTLTRSLLASSPEGLDSPIRMHVKLADTNTGSGRTHVVRVPVLERKAARAQRVSGRSRSVLPFLQNQLPRPSRLEATNQRRPVGTFGGLVDGHAVHRQLGLVLTIPEGHDIAAIAAPFHLDAELHRPHALASHRRSACRRKNQHPTNHGALV